MSRLGASRGFVLSLEFILMVTILLIGMLAGCVLIRDELIEFVLNKQRSGTWARECDTAIADEVTRGCDAGDGTWIGRIIDFNQFEDPLVILRDSGAQNRRVLLGVRDDRFTTRHQIFYQDTNCTDTPCIIRPGNESFEAPSIAGVGPAGSEGFIGYLYPLQQPPQVATPTTDDAFSYGVGRDVNQTFGGLALPGTLYRSEGSCGITATPDSNGLLTVSAWTSQALVSGEPCFSLDLCGSVTKISGSSGAFVCVGGSEAACIGPPANRKLWELDTTCDGAANETVACDWAAATTTCSCPVVDGQQWVLTNNKCCPPGFDGIASGQCRVDLASALAGTTVVKAHDGTSNILSVYDPPNGLYLHDGVVLEGVAPVDEADGLGGN